MCRRAGCAEGLDVVDESDEEIKKKFAVLKEIFGIIARAKAQCV